MALLGSRQSLLPIKYMGLPFDAKFKEKMFWNLILKKLE